MGVQGIVLPVLFLNLCCIFLANGGLIPSDRFGTQKTEQHQDAEVKAERIKSASDEDVGTPPSSEDERSLKKEFTRGTKMAEFSSNKMAQMLKKYKRGKKNKNKKSVVWTVPSLGVNMNNLFENSALFLKTPRENKWRDGFPTDTDSCDNVRAVPKWLRDPKLISYPVHSTYTKYTEAYGIPVLGSNDVTVEGLKRACYEVKFLLADRYDLRYALYLLYVRVALIGDNQEQTDLYEYWTWDKTYWDDRARGLGPSLEIPLASAGDDNQRCKPGERYANQDIMVHEFCHGIHLMGAVFVIEGFQRRLTSAFNTAMKEGRFKGYGSKNKNEYFAVGCQIYFDVLTSKENTFESKINGVTMTLSNRHTLSEYDPALTALLDEMFPCQNHFVNRCTWKECTINDFTLIHDRTKVSAKSMCTVVKSAYNKKTPEACAEYTCYHMGNAFNFKATTRAVYCHVLHCKDPTNLEIDQMSGAWDVYKINSIPKLDLTAEKSTAMKTMCTTNVEEVLIDDTNKKSRRCLVKVDDRVPFGPTPTKDSKAVCKSRGGCFESGYGCYHPTQEVADRSISCFEWATEDGGSKCLNNPATMLRVCPLSCNAVKTAYRIKQNDAKVEAVCHDVYTDCVDMDCGKYAKNNCRLKCKTCNLQSDWKKAMGVPNLKITQMKV